MEIIYDKGVYFGYLREFPGICVQGESEEEVRRKIRLYYKEYLKG